MSLASVAVKRPVFITSIVVLILSLGLMSVKRLPVDLFPDVTFPVVLVNTIYPGAGPEEIETQVSKVLEEEISTLSGVKTVRSISKEGISTVVAEFSLETDVKFAEQQIKDRVNSVRSKLPESVKDPVTRRIDPSDQPIMILAVTGKMPKAQLYDLVNDKIKPKIEQIKQVGLVQILGGQKREVRVELDRRALKSHEMSALMVTDRISKAGLNVPAGKVSGGNSETVIRTLGEFRTVKDIGETVINFLGNDVAVKVKDVAQVMDGLEEEKSKTFVNGDPSLFLMVFRQSGANTIAVCDGVKAQMLKLNEEFKDKINVESVRDLSKYIRSNVIDVQESIGIGIFLTILVVFFFLGNWRSTLITGAALPNSLLGAFILMAIAGFSINLMTLLALSLAVGLLIDDAIVVRENIFRHMEMGKKSEQAALDGSHEVTLAVLATTLTVIAVFGPIAFLQGVVGQFFKQFGLTICFAMLISLFDALTIAPMLSAYLPANVGHGGKNGKLSGILNAFERFQIHLEDQYERILRFTLRRPGLVLGGAFLLFVLSLASTALIRKTFLPAQDNGEFTVSLELAPGASLEAMTKTAGDIDKMLRAQPEVVRVVQIVGNRDGESNIADMYVELVARSDRKKNTSEFKAFIREKLKEYSFANPRVKDIDMVGGGRPFNVSIMATSAADTVKAAKMLFDKLKVNPGLADVEISDKPGKPEFQADLNPQAAEQYGVSSVVIGKELRNLIQGEVPVVFRENGGEYDVRVRLREDQRDMKSGFQDTFVPNLNQSLVRLSNVAKPVSTTGPATINRQDRGRYVMISADIDPAGPGLGKVMQDIKQLMEKDLNLPQGVKYRYIGQAENFTELISSIIQAVILGILFIYLVLASLYESFITPLTIMLVLPLAACGAFFGLLIGHGSLDIFSMIGCVMLLGIATKNSILLVDKTNQLVRAGKDLGQAVIEAGRNRLRPILMTSYALIAGMLPVAIGLNEASRQRTSMGIAVIGGLVSSTLLTLIVVPAAFSFIERFRAWSLARVRKRVGLDR